MDDLALMQVHEGSDYLRQVILHLHLCESLAPLQKFIQSLIGAYLQQNIHVLVVLEDMFELDNVLVVQRLMDFDLGD